MRRMKAEGRRMKADAHRMRGTAISPFSSFILPPSSFPRLCRGFSFTEIMFAVMILGIGFIMVAAIFPVALQQSKSTTEEITAAPNARGAVNYLAQLIADGPQPTDNVATLSSNTSNCPPALGNKPVSGFNVIGIVTQPGVQDLLNINVTNVTPPSIYNGPGLWNALRGNMILPEDPRYGFVTLYLRRLQDPTRLNSAGQPDTNYTNWNPYVQVFVFPVQARATPTFTQADVTIPDGVSSLTFSETQHHVPNLMARPVQVVVLDSDSLSATIPQLTGQPDLLAFDTTSALNAAFPKKVENVQAAIEGAYVVIADDKINSPAGPHTTTPPTPDDRGRMNGRLFRLGARRADLDNSAIFSTLNSSVVYELQPGSDFTADLGDDGIKGQASSPNWPHNDDINTIGMDSSGTDEQEKVIPGTSSANAYLIGKGYSDPTNPAGGYEGAAMPIGAYVTFVKVK